MVESILLIIISIYKNFLTVLNIIHYHEKCKEDITYIMFFFFVYFSFVVYVCLVLVPRLDKNAVDHRFCADGKRILTN